MTLVLSHNKGETEMRMFENSVLKIKSGPEMGDVAVVGRKLRNEELHKFQSVPGDQI